MKKFTLIFTLLLAFCSVNAFGAADGVEYVVSPSTGTQDGNNSTSWAFATSNAYPAELTLTATNEIGTPVKNISLWSNGTKHSLKAYYNDRENTSYTTTYTIAVPQDKDYKISGYSIKFSGWKSVAVENQNGTQTLTNLQTATLEESGLDTYSVSFSVKRIENNSSSTAAAAIDITEFIVYIKKESPQIESRTISAVATEGGSVTINGGNEAVIGTESVQLVATPAYGYKFVNWTVNEEEVATSAEYTDNTAGDKVYVANFVKYVSINEWYEAIDKPTFVMAGNTTFISEANVNGANVENIPSSGAATDVAKQSGATAVIPVAKGAELNLNITYTLNWGDLAIFQLDNDGENLEYGYYFGSWEANATVGNEKVLTYMQNDNISVTDLVDGKFTATYPISINESHNVGDLIVVRAMTGVMNGSNNSASEKNISEGGYVDFLFQVVESETPVSSYTLEIGEEGWASLYLGYNAAIPNEVEAYIVKKENITNNSISLTRVTGVLPANTGVLVKGTVNTECVFTESEEAVADVTGNLLKGVLENTDMGTAIYYVLADGQNGVGLYKVQNAATEGAHIAKANRAYLLDTDLAVELQNSNGFRFDFGDGTTTEIDEVKTENGNVKTVYDLQGRIVENPTVGIYIVNGKKVLVK